MEDNNNPYTKFEFLTGIGYSGEEYVGIVVNQDNQMLTFYDVNAISNTELKKIFLEYGELWWWESNRQIPIDIFLYYEMQPFKNCIKTFALKDVEIIFGPTISLHDLLKKRVKRRNIQLIRRVD